MNLKNFSFYNVFNREPSYKERDQFAAYSREELIDALVAANETVVTNAENASDRYDNMVESYEEKIAKTSKKTAEDAAATARAVMLADEDKDRKHNQKVADLTAAHKAELAELTQAHKLEVEALTAETEIATERASLEGEFTADKKVKDAEQRAIDAEKGLAVALAENAILGTMIDINGDITDIKGLAEKIIDKLPTINLSSLPSAAPAPKEKGNKD